MVTNYSERKIGRAELPDGYVSTAEVYDGDHPYETLVVHDQFEPDNVVVEAYDTKSAAKKGHAKWVKIMKSKRLPTKLVDCMNSTISQITEPVIAKRKSKK